MAAVAGHTAGRGPEQPAGVGAPGGPLAAARGVPYDACPLCGTPLAPEQDWCMRCGAAARTRLAAAPNWRVPVAVLVAIVVLALAAIAAGVVKLAGQTNAPPPILRTVTTPAPAPPAVPQTQATTPAVPQTPATPAVPQTQATTPAVPGATTGR
jgi:hypothetical protein